MKLSRIMALALALVLALCVCATAETVFPIVTEPTTLTVLSCVKASYPDQDFGKVSSMVYYEQLSGVHIEWTNVDSDIFNSTLASMIASNEKLPDIIFHSGVSNANLADWGGQGIIIDLKPYLDENCPNFVSLMEKEATIGGAIYSENGNIYGLPQVILGAEMRTPTKLWLNKKAMAAVGMDDPVTLDDFVAVMTAIRDSDWNKNGENDEITVLASSGNLLNHFYGAFGLRTRGAHHDVVDVDPETDELRIFALNEDFRSFLEYMHMMYEEKLIYPEIFTEGDKQASTFAAEDRLSCLLNTVSPSAPAEKLEDWYTINWSLEGPEGYAFHTQTRGAVHSTGNFVITADCPEEKIPVALKWVDYFYSEEGSRLCLVGVEGQDWEEKEDGTLDWTDAALAKRTDAMNDETFRSLFGLWPGGKVPTCFYSNLFGAEYGPIPAACAQALLNDYAPEVIWPNMNWTADELAVISTKGTDIVNYVKTSAANIIAGEMELTDEWWNEFKTTIENMGAEEYLAAYESGLTRVYGEGAKF